MAMQTFLTNSVNAHTYFSLLSAVTADEVDSSQEHDNDTLEAPANKFAPVYDRKEPLRSSGLHTSLVD